MSTTVRHLIRSKMLESIVNPKRLKAVWKATVRQGLRRQPLADIHDYLDVHLQIDEVTERLAEEVHSGFYRPRHAHVVPHEKRDGISRRLLVPTAADALVLQTLIDSLEPKVLKLAPANEQAFYSRSHDGPRISDVDDTFAYPWWQLWGEFQKEIFQFANDYPLLVVTDLANFYDSVPLALMRNQIASMTDADEVVLDLLFLLLESFVWRPDYAPQSGMGLPQLNFDAPRLLAHAYLFGADKFLKEQTSGDFVRWMDDIDFGVKAESNAKNTLHHLQKLVNSSGLHLNAGKTKILSKNDAFKYFWLRENQNLTVIQNLIETRPTGVSSLRRAKAFLRARFSNFEDAHRVGQWDKLYKRFFTQFGRLQDPLLQSRVPQLLNSTPSLRETIIKYYLRFGYSTERFAHMLEFLDRVGREDTCILLVAKLFTQWIIPSGVAKSKLLPVIDLFSGPGKSQVEAAAALWLSAKYGSREHLADVVLRTEPRWRTSEWCARQAAGITPRLDAEDRRTVAFTLGSYGLVEGTRVIQNLTRIRRSNRLDIRLKGYIQYKPNLPWPYGLERALMARVVLESEISEAEKRSLKKHIFSATSDPIYRVWVS